MDWQGHEAIVETYEGQGAYGDIYSDPATIACWRNEKRQMVRGKGGEEVVSEMTLIITDPADAARVTVDSKVTTNGYTSYVVAVSTLQDGRPGSWGYTEVNLR